MIDGGAHRSIPDALALEVDTALESYLAMGRLGKGTQATLSSLFNKRPPAKL